METVQELLRATVAEFLKIEPAEVRAELPLAGRRLQGSIGRATLDAALRRRLGGSYPAAYTAATYGELEAMVLSPGGQRPEPAPAPAGKTGPEPPAPAGGAEQPAGLSCGIDVEMVENLPAAEDYWAEEFYRTTFSPAEIAYCALQRNPPMHFAARWCAKEALRKCDAAFLGEPLAAVELVHDQQGRPHLRRVADAPGHVLPFAVSVAHTAVLAVAAVVQFALPVPAPAPPAPPPESPRRSRSALGAALLALAAAGLSVWALLRTF
jgi:phosphopantetheine--protein transferase-like protein